MVALIASLWAYDGWNDLTMVAGEVKRPERSLPIALIAGVGVVGVLYMATNAAIQYILPAASIAVSARPAVVAMSVVSGHWGASLVSVAMALSILVGLNGTTMSGARVPFAAARDRLFPARMAHIHPRFQSPSTSLVAQGLLSTVLLLLVGRFQQLFELAIFAEWLFYLLTTTTIFVYRRRIPAAERPFRSWGYPVLPVLFIVAAAVLLYYSFASNLRSSLLGTLIILAVYPCTWCFVPLSRADRWATRSDESRSECPHICARLFPRDVRIPLSVPTAQLHRRNRELKKGGASYPHLAKSEPRAYELSCTLALTRTACAPFL